MLDETATRILFLLLDTVTPILAGIFLHKKGWVSRQGTQRVMTFNVRVVFTILALISFWNIHFSASVFWIPVIGLVITFFPFFVMMVATRRESDPKVRGALVTSGMLGNTGSLGGIICFLLLGAPGYAYVQIVAVLQNLILIVFNFPLAQRFADEAAAKAGRESTAPKKRSFAELFFTWNQIALVGMIVGAALSLTETAQPEWLVEAFTPLVHVSTWIAFLPVGLLFDFDSARRFIVKTLPLIPLKFIVMPLLIWGICSLTVSDPVMSASLIILSSCPTAINSIITCALYGLKTHVAECSFMTTTPVFAFVLCPVFFWLFG